MLSLFCLTLSSFVAVSLAAGGPTVMFNLTVVDAEKEMKALAGNKSVISIVGYSALGYDDEDTLRAMINTTLSKFDPKTVLVNGGATQEGIGIMYAIAKKLGFQTTGVVSSMAIKSAMPNATIWADGVDTVLVVNDESYGGYVAGPTATIDRTLQPTSQVMVDVSETIFGFGGNYVAYAELFEAQNGFHKNVRFYALEFNHANAKDGSHDYLGFAAHNLVQCGDSLDQVFDRCGICAGDGTMCSRNFQRYFYGSLLRLVAQQAKTNATVKLAVFNLENAIAWNDPFDVSNYELLPGVADAMQEVIKNQYVVVFMSSQAKYLTEIISPTTFPFTTATGTSITGTTTTTATTAAAATTTTVASTTTDASTTTMNHGNTTSSSSSTTTMTSAGPAPTPTPTMKRKRTVANQFDQFNYTIVDMIESKIDRISKDLNVSALAYVDLIYSTIDAENFQNIVLAMKQEPEFQFSIDFKNSFMVGNDAGRIGDTNCADRTFAKEAGLNFMTLQMWLLGAVDEPFNCAKTTSTAGSTSWHSTDAPSSTTTTSSSLSSMSSSATIEDDSGSNMLKLVLAGCIGLFVGICLVATAWFIVTQRNKSREKYHLLLDNAEEF